MTNELGYSTVSKVEVEFKRKRTLHNRVQRCLQVKNKFARTRILKIFEFSVESAPNLGPPDL